MFATRRRARPWTARIWLESSVRAKRSVASWTSMVTPAGSRCASSPFGPRTRTSPAACSTVTPFGIAMGSRPTRDMRSPDLADDLAADALLPRLAVDHDAARRGEHVDAEPAPDGRNLGGADVDAEARAAHALEPLDDRSTPAVVAEPEAKLGMAFLLDGHLREVAFGLQRARDGLLVARPRHVDRRLPGRAAVADAREHVGDGIGQHGRLTSWPSRRRESAPARRACAGRCGTCESGGRRRAAARRARSGCRPAPGTWAGGKLSPSTTSWPCPSIRPGTACRGGAAAPCLPHPSGRSCRSPRSVP